MSRRSSCAATESFVGTANPQLIILDLDWWLCLRGYSQIDCGILCLTTVAQPLDICFQCSLEKDFEILI